MVDVFLSAQTKTLHAIVAGSFLLLNLQKSAAAEAELGLPNFTHMANNCLDT